jgi:group II intron reverse transcriptase/maturase
MPRGRTGRTAAKGTLQRTESEVGQLDLGLEASDGHRLYEEVCLKRTLERAFRKVKANQGAPGPDGESLEEFEEDLDHGLEELREELVGWTYQPGPIRRVVIPKPGGGDRLLGVANVRDRIVEEAMAMVMEPLFEPGFSDHSYGFRPGRSQRDAIAKAKEYVGEGREWIVDLDLERFFDTVNHDRVIHLLRSKVGDRRMIRLVAMTLRRGIWIDGKVEKSREGLPQGSPLSPLLSNIVLDELDRELEKRGLHFVRYADDCNVFVRSQKAAERVLEKLTRFIEGKLKLKVNRTKSKTGLSSTVKFLGMTVLAGGIVAISAGAMTKAKAKVKELIPRSGKAPLEAQLESVNRWYRGWAGYFAMGEYPSQLRAIEARIRVRFRLQFIKNHKRKKYLVRKLVKRGIRRETAYRETYLRNHGRWRLAHTFSVGRAWPERWFREQGLTTVSGEHQSHWKSLKAYPRLS